jgi:hypothetical protein
LRALLVVLPLTLAACATSDGKPHPPLVALHAARIGEWASPEHRPFGTDAPALGFDGRGLLIGTGSAKLTVLPFGTPQEQVETAVSRIFHGKVKAKRFHSDECGAGPMDSVEFFGLILNFQDGEFVGIFDQEAPGTAMLGQLAVGLPRSEAERRAHILMVPDSTLGQEFSYPDTDGVAGGFFDGTGPSAKISGLYAGTTCFFR